MLTVSPGYVFSQIGNLSNSMQSKTLTCTLGKIINNNNKKKQKA